ncbi:hypothetical protein PTI98_011712 [Pleurotus ostreatus]|nr:hypothetical protein PTI98_011712 [Pleurotus ostreatus]
MILPIVHAVYMRFTPQYTPDLRLNVHGIFLPNHILSRHIPATSQIGIPESLHSLSPSIRFFRAPMVAPSHALTTVKINPGAVFLSPVAGRREGDTPQARSSTVTLGKRQWSTTPLQRRQKRTTMRIPPLVGISGEVESSSIRIDCRFCTHLPTVVDCKT